MIVLGIWDGHDSGAALVCDNEIRFATNEERLTRRKLEVSFPQRSIQAALDHERLPANAVDAIAVSTSDLSKTLHRFFPGFKEQYYQLRRRQKLPTGVRRFQKLNKYWLTEFGGSWLTRSLSELAIRRWLRTAGLSRHPLRFVDHHLCHAAAAAFTSPFDRCLVVTLDGLGDGLSASLSIFAAGRLRRIAAIPARTSFGIFFEHVTNLMNMRELEDEGKVMALADYASPVPDDENPLVRFFAIDGLAIRARFGSLAMHRELARVLYRVPFEQFAFMAQRALEKWVVEWVANALQRTGERNVALAGGVASNIKVNRLLRNMDAVDDCWVFPHMGDGGLALGAAIWETHTRTQFPRFALESAQLGQNFRDDEIECALRTAQLPFSTPPDLAARAAAAIAAGGIVFWFQGRSELGPRALGGRSILARPDSPAIKDALNLKLKKRVRRQPFCPSILEADAQEAFEDAKGRPNRFMTMGYMVKPEWRDRLAGVINIDGSCRPQIVDREPPLFAELLQEMKRRTGVGALLNTSFNRHGEPMVNSPADAVRAFAEMEADALVIGRCLVTRR
jgi:carbamoyltransferase